VFGFGPGWRRTYARTLKATEFAVLCGTTMIVLALAVDPGIAFAPALVLAMSVTTAWVGVMSLAGAYDTRFLASGPIEFRKVARAAAQTLALLAAVFLLADFAGGREFLLHVFPVAFSALLVDRYIARRVLRRLTGVAGLGFRVLLVGDTAHAASVIAALEGRDRDHGFSVVGACTDEGPASSIDGIPVLGRYDEVLTAAWRAGADVVAVAPSAHLTSEDVRALGWALDGSGIELAVIPPLRDVVESRVVTRPVSGVQLLFVEPPARGVALGCLKAVMDRVAAAAALLLLSPLFLLLALAIRVDSDGPALFRQQRVGKDGVLFRVWKFRTMVTDAETLKKSLASANESDGLLFKMKVDPRVTRVGAFLRRWSIDEVPQLINVLTGEMSLIGPRPLPVSPDDFKGPERRRLLVKPGITGLWQVSGRSDTTWDEAVRLDLYYVDNWSPSLDLTILWRTVSAVLGNRGAY